MSESVREILSNYEGKTYADLTLEISDAFTGETGDLIREHAKLILALTAVDRALAFAPRSMSLGEMSAFETKGSLPWVRMLMEARAVLDGKEA